MARWQGKLGRINMTHRPRRVTMRVELPAGLLHPDQSSPAGSCTFMESNRSDVSICTPRSVAVAKWEP